MNGINVTITDMMNCRDRRVSIQNELISKYDKPVLSFCMNIPGPVKTNEQIRKAFDFGKAELLKSSFCSQYNNPSHRRIPRTFR